MPSVLQSLTGSWTENNPGWYTGCNCHNPFRRYLIPIGVLKKKSESRQCGDADKTTEFEVFGSIDLEESLQKESDSQLTEPAYVSGDHGGYIIVLRSQYYLTKYNLPISKM